MDSTGYGYYFAQLAMESDHSIPVLTDPIDYTKELVVRRLAGVYDSYTTSPVTDQEFAEISEFEFIDATLTNSLNGVSLQYYALCAE